MILDRSLCFDGGDNSTFAAITVTRDSTDIIDVGLSGQIGNGRDIAVGNDLHLLVLSNRLFAGGTSVQISLQGAPDNGSGGQGTYTTYAQTPAITLAQLNAAPGMLFPIALPRPPFGGLALPRFYKLNYTVVGTFSAGAVLAYLLLNREDGIQYPSALNVANV
jgi:hypothetical protein